MSSSSLKVLGASYPFKTTNRAQRIVLIKLSLGERKTFSHNANTTPDSSTPYLSITQVLYTKFQAHYQLLSDNKSKQNAMTSSIGK